MRKNGEELEAAAGTVASALVSLQEKEEMEQDEEGARASRAREDGDEGAKADAKADKKGSGGFKHRGAQGE